MFKKISLLFLISVVTACTDSSNLDIEGKLYMKGTSIDNYLVLEDSINNVSYKIQNATLFNLNKQQNKKVKLNVKVIKKEISPGFPMEVKILKVY